MIKADRDVQWNTREKRKAEANLKEEEVKYKPSGLIKNGPKTDVAPVINEESVDNKEDIVQDTVKSKNE